MYCEVVPTGLLNLPASPADRAAEVAASVMPYPLKVVGFDSKSENSPEVATVENEGFEFRSL